MKVWERIAQKPSIDARDGGITESSHAVYIADKHRRAAAPHLRTKMCPKKITQIRTEWDESYSDTSSRDVRDLLIEKLSKKYKCTRVHIRQIVSNKNWKSVALCKNPYRARTRKEVQSCESQEREFLKQCLRDAALKLALRDGIFKVKLEDIHEEAGVGRLRRVYKSMYEVLEEIEPLYYERKYKNNT